jgi:hypothetical protein
MARRPVRRARGGKSKRQSGARRQASAARSKAAKARRPARPKRRTPARAAKPPAAKSRRRVAAARPNAARAGRRIAPALDRERRRLEETVPTPPSSLNLDRHATAARTGRAELRENLQKHTGMTPALTGGDVDANWEEAYFTGDEAPGGDNPTPDQDVVDDIGKALGVQYDDNEELKSSDKISERDKHRWELDPASSEDYKNRK